MNHDPSGIYFHKTTIANEVNFIAAVNMFFNKFPNSDGSDVRVVTLVANCREMRVFSAMNLFAEQANMDHGDIFGWIFSPSLKNELITLLHKIDNEFSRPDSYAPYLKDLGLVNKSFLSYTANPGLSSFFAITGAYAGMPRCLNAGMSQHGSSNEALFNAKVAGYVIRTKGAIVAPLVISTSTPYDYSDVRVCPKRYLSRLNRHQLDAGEDVSDDWSELSEVQRAIIRDFGFGSYW
ncbi:Hypothetical predicted protein [Cloeon dipterum]|uniref:Rhabdovirus nucleocapsid domain-containing protein n=1 Tax=Cloeon dipterum TaxID=197152 RepID=A0A8S1E7N7_9INSE|nr:Hypothetical predicted protein [Cloeon dipterum]